MTCCNQKRQALRSPATPNRAQRRTVRVEYLGARRITLFSSASMRTYTFDRSTALREQLVTAQDAKLLLRRRSFRRVE